VQPVHVDAVEHAVTSVTDKSNKKMSNDQQSNQSDKFPRDGSPEEIAEWILNTAEEVHFKSEVLRIAMDLPSVRDVSIDELPKVISHVLERFNIKLPEEFAEAIRNGEKDQFTFNAPAVEPNLRPRTVTINTSPEIRTLFIRGEAPLNGVDGSLKVFFDYEVRPGKLRPDGTIDFREINRFPQAQKDDLLLRLYEPTPGVAGTNVHGHSIKPVPGEPVHIEIGEGITKKDDFDDDSNRQCIDFFATYPGVVICEFEGNIRDVNNLRKMSIKNKLVVTNVDFSTGNLGDEVEEIRCVADVTVQGDIRGRFSVIIDGHLEVKGDVEGEKVDVSKSFIAAFVKSSVRAGKTIDVGAALNADLEAEELIIISRELNQTKLKAKRIIIKPRNVSEVLCGKATLIGNNIQLERVTLRNVLKIDLAPDLFLKISHLKDKEKYLERLLEYSTVELRDKLAILGDKIKLTQKMIPEDEKKNLQLLKTMVALMLKGEITREKVKKKVQELCESSAAELRALSKWVLQIVELNIKIAKLKEAKEDVVREKKALQEETDTLTIQISGTIRSTGMLLVKCGEQELAWQTPPDKETMGIKLGLRYISGEGLVQTA